jgi:4-amino-4-deoxy-L-arabinose transferase-like glycosyltransferase
LVVIALLGMATFLTCTISPPHLMDDVDAAEAQLARTMLRSGDWITGRLDGVVFLDKAPLKYWITAALYSIFGVHDVVARLPSAFSAILLSILVFRIFKWAGSEKAGFYAGVTLSTSIGLFLFTRIVIPDVILTLALTLCIWSFLRVIEEPEKAFRWSLVLYSTLACGILLKGLIGVLFPIAIFAVYGAITGNAFKKEVWRRLHLLPGVLIFTLIAVPWHVLAIINNPPHFDLTLHPGPHFGYRFRGFFWFYFINEQLLRFLNSRWPRDYNTVPRLWFWLYQILWFFPWSFFLVVLRRSDFSLSSRQGRLRIIAGIWVLVVMIFFTFSTTQEYYSMPVYPALAILIGSCMNSDRRWLGKAAKLASCICALAAVAAATILIKTAGLPTPGDISQALTQNPNLYTLSLGHIADLTLRAFAYLRVPLALAAVAFAMGAIAPWIAKGRKTYLLTALMLVCLFQAARLALIVFDPYMSSEQLAEALNRAPRGTLISNGPYYNFSALYFYTNYQSLILNGRLTNLEYGSYAPGGSRIFINDSDFAGIWSRHARCYIATEDNEVEHLRTILGQTPMYLLSQSGGKSIWSNLPFS